jgi:hypothetical protein
VPFAFVHKPWSTRAFLGRVSLHLDFFQDCLAGATKRRKGNTGKNALFQARPRAFYALRIQCNFNIIVIGEMRPATDNILVLALPGRPARHDQPDVSRSSISINAVNLRLTDSAGTITFRSSFFFKYQPARTVAGNFSWD